jgi:UDP-N-acetylmuramate dehydrogenase
MVHSLPAAVIESLRSTLADDMRENESLARYTSVRIGGQVDVLVVARSAKRLAESALLLWNLEVPFRVIGGGSNVLVADEGVRGAVILNQARKTEFQETTEGLQVRVESGASLSRVARQAVERGWAGMEWATTIPGTIGGAIVGNAGAHGGDVSGILVMADILQHGKGVEQWFPDRLEYAYRDSWLKRNPGRSVVLAATFRLDRSTPEETTAKMHTFVDRRQRTQPPGASMGSMFKNPPGDYAGRLIDAAGLKGRRQGGAQISQLHGNFFINIGGAKAADVWELVQIARKAVAEQFGIELELEVELIGEWEMDRIEVAQPGEGGEV